MEHQQEMSLLERYAEASSNKILASQADLDPKDRAMPDMLSWCREHKTIVVLQSGTILTSQPGSRVVQNCKIVMVNKSLVPGTIYPATSELIRMLLANAQEQPVVLQTDNVVAVSTQQQRLRLLVKEALDIGATDIHLEIRAELARIRFRKHGELFLHAEWLSKLAREVASVAFNKETDHAITHFNPLVPQNASMPLQIDNREVRLRLASLPAHGGFDVVMRILTLNDEKVATLEDLGYLHSQADMIKKAINMPYGAVILSGPTGSGKTTTLASCMQLVNPQRKVYTIEDPVEKLITEATQIPVNTEHYDRSFASMARTTLRMDPDVVVLGEMRDEDTAAVMARAAITGHLVFSTVHTNTATEIVTRLEDLGISRSLLASPNLLVCLICQRLAPTLCKYCAISVAQSGRHKPHLSRWHEAFGYEFLQVRARGKKKDCERCHGMGIGGRTVVAELIWVDERGRQFIQQGDTLGWRKYLKKNSWITYADQIFHMVKVGTCDPLDAEMLIGEINPSINLEQYQYAKVG